MSSTDEVIERFLGGDPIAGAQGLQELLVLGNSGEEALFSRPIEFPKTAQVRRRWLQYVASRKATVVPRLLDRMQNQSQFRDSYAVAHLFAGLSEDRDVTNALFGQLKSSFPYDGDDRVSNRLIAWGHAGGGSATLWHFLAEDGYAWEKLLTSAFRASCSAFARVNSEDDWAIEQLITHERRDSGMGEIENSPDTSIAHKAVDDAEMWLQANDKFVVWRRGEVADTILRNWSRHEHWRVRDFGAKVLARLGFQRTVTLVIDWLSREGIERIRGSLLHTLERSETTLGADALIQRFESSGQEARPYVAKAAWRASDKGRAATALNAIASSGDSAAAEAVVSLARLGHRHAQLTAMLDSLDSYCRSNAALAVAYLDDKSAIERLVAMRKEAAAPIERVYLAAALAILGMPNGAVELNQELIAAASARDYDQRLDVFFLHRYLQRAILDGFEAADSQDGDLLKAWRAELEPLEPIPRPVEVAATAKPAAASVPQTSAAEIPQSESGPQPVTAAGPLHVFISYSHRDEKMRVKLEQHLAPLVDDGMIQIWHDREIEAGADWEGEISKEIGAADIILLLVSASFLASRYCRNELQRALKQRSAGKALPIPIILRPCEWTSVFNRQEYKAQALPRDDRPVAGGPWPSQDAAFAVIAKELRAQIERMRR